MNNKTILFLIMLFIIVPIVFTKSFGHINKDLNSIESIECLICTEAFIGDDIIKKIKCNHLFHTDCIKPWLCEESNKCPVCRIDIDKGTQK